MRPLDPGSSKVLLLTNAIAPDKPGGLYRYVRELSRHLAAAGVEVVVSTRAANSPNKRAVSTEDGVLVYRHWTPKKSNPLFPLLVVLASILSALRLIRKYPHHIVHAHFPVQGAAAALSKAPFVYTFHAPVYRELLSERQNSYLLPGFLQSAAVEALRRVERQVLLRASIIVVLSEFMKKEVLLLDPLAEDRIEIVSGGVDTEFFFPAVEQRSPWEGENSGILIVVARRLVSRTGVLEFLEAFKRVKQSQELEARLAILGDGLLREKISSRIRELGLDDSARLYGQVSDLELRRLYRTADIVVVPTIELEGFGLSSAEAFSCGAVVVGTPSSANLEVIGRVSSKLLAEEASSNSLAAVICNVLTDIRLKEAVRRDGPSTVFREWSWARVSEKYAIVYDRVGVRGDLEGRRPAR